MGCVSLPRVARVAALVSVVGWGDSPFMKEVASVRRILVLLTVVALRW